MNERPDPRDPVAYAKWKRRPISSPVAKTTGEGDRSAQPSGGGSAGSNPGVDEAASAPSVTSPKGDAPPPPQAGEEDHKLFAAPAWPDVPAEEKFVLGGHSKRFKAKPKGSAEVVALPAAPVRPQRPRPPAQPYAELGVQSCFSFLRAASFPEELVDAAQAVGCAGIGIADRNTVAGVVRAHVAAKKAGIRLVVGARLAFSDGTPDVIAYPEHREGWGRLTRLLSLGNLKPHVVKGGCDLTLSDLQDHAEGLLLIVVAPERPDDSLAAVLRALRSAAPDRVWLGLAMRRGAADARRLRVAQSVAEAAGVPLLALSEALHHTPERKALLDVMTCIREHVTLDKAGRLLERNAERTIKAPAEISRLFRAAPDAVAESLRVMNRARFSMENLVYDYPGDDIPQGMTAQEELERRVAEHVPDRFPEGLTPEQQATVSNELSLIQQMDYAKYFLTVHNVVQAAVSMNILCQGRGSAANSVVCYILGITSVDPRMNDLLFERFISTNRNEPPDIDVDFEHERREEVIQWIYQRYGRERAAIAATVITYRARSAIREVGKAFGLTDDVINQLSSTIWGWSNEPTAAEGAARVGLDVRDPVLMQVLTLARQIIGFPRHLSQHVGGFVVTRGRLDEIVPVGKAAMDDRTFIEWDKDDLDALGMLKIDVLALGMLTCTRKAFELIEQAYGERVTLTSMTPDDPDVYDMICRADTLGVFQIESRAQQAMLPRLRPRKLYDLVIEVAIVRPGPIQGEMVHPYLRRRQGLEPVSYPMQALEPVLRKTLGVPLFQEQAMRIAIVGASFTPAEADQLRRAMATFRHVGTIGQLRAKFVQGMIDNQCDPEFAEACFNQIEGFGSYGFPESHAAAFASLAYVSCWLKARYPDAFCAALLNSQPMGFYAPAQIVRDAQEHGVEVRAVDVASSDWDCTLEPEGFSTDRLHRRHKTMEGVIWSTRAVRLGLRQVKGLSEADGRAVAAARASGCRTMEDLGRVSGAGVGALEKLAEADAFRSMGLNRREALWQARALTGRFHPPSEPQTRAALHVSEPDVALPKQTLGESVVDDYRRTSLSLKAHPVSFLRDDMRARGIVPAERLETLNTDSWVKVAGLVLVRQMPGTAGVVFLTLEDETAISNIIVWPKMYEKFRPEVIGGRLLSVTGRLQREKEVIHVVSYKIEDLSFLLKSLGERGGELSILANADEVRRPNHQRAKIYGSDAGSFDKPPRARHPREQQLGMFDDASQVIPLGRAFH